ncbi:hypothetical protein B0A49_12024, partial [Cryomyces minteri]
MDVRYPLTVPVRLKPDLHTGHQIEWNQIISVAYYINHTNISPLTPFNPVIPSNTIQTDTLKPTTLILVLLTGILMAFTMPSLMSRLFRPFSSQPMRFNPETAAQNYPEGSQKCTLAAGCFWGVEHMYRHTFANKGLIDAGVGYIGGDSKNPSYRAVCSGRTGHAEALQIIFDPSQLSYKTLLEFFYKMHDPTTSNRQGPDT